MKNIMIFLLSVLLFSCGEKKEKEPPIRLADYDEPYSGENSKENSSAAETTKTTDSDAAQADVFEVALEGNDRMQFNKDEIRVPAGSTVKLTLIHTGQMPKTAMGHNFVLLTQGTDVGEFGMKAVKFPDNNYIPPNTDKVIAYTKIIGGGESITIEFQAPEPGTYTFICSFPGHYAMMQGTFVVE